MTGDELTLTVSLLDQLVTYPTVSCDSNLDLITYLGNLLTSYGARVDIFQDKTGQKANLFATFGPDRPGGVVLSGHTDVVPVADQDWTSDPFHMRHSGQRLYGRGTCDMKGFIAACVVMARQFGTMDLHRPIHLAFTYDEEVGCIGASALVPELQRRGLKPAMAIIGEPTEMRVVEGHKGCCEYTTRFSGLEGHGSTPDRGVNAVEYAVRYVSRLLQLRQDLIAKAPHTSRFDPQWSTLNIGRINGGVAHNVIANKAEVEWEMRPVVQQDANFVKRAIGEYVEGELLPAMRAIWPGADITTEIIGEIAGLEPMADNAARDLVAGLVGVDTADVAAYCTEAGLFQQMGMSVVICGPGSIEQAHMADEFVAIDQLAACLDMLDRLGQNLASSR
jgi:acetylornithine deacetylase